MKSDNDRILVVTAEQANLNSLVVTKMVSDQLEEKGCLGKSEIKVLPNNGKEPKEIIREYLVETGDVDVDFVFVGNTGADFNKTKDHFLGKVSNELICHTKLNTVFVCQ